MQKLTVEDTDRMIEQLCEIVFSDETLTARLNNSPNKISRWIELESYIDEHLQDVNLSYLEFHQLWIRERFFFAMQQKTQNDYGFCEHHINAYRNLTESILTGNLTLDLDHKCCYQTEPIPTTCSGTDKDICVFLHPELKERREKLMESYLTQIIRKRNAPNN